MNDLIRLFKESIEQHNLFAAGDSLVLAVSGGVDSVVLCELCHLAGYHFVIAHCNFQLRGAESERDEQFVRDLAGKYGADGFFKSFETEGFAQQKKISVQVAARTLRYQWFNELADCLEAKKQQPVRVVTAHHADDNLETVLMNFFKGTGIAGIRGMLPLAGRLVRPLLFARKKWLMDFAAERELKSVEDSSNASDKYSRNYLRHHIVPLIKEQYPGAEENILHSIQRFREVELLYQQAIIKHKENLLEQRGDEVFIAVGKLLKTNPLRSVVFEIVKAFGFSAKQVEEVIGLMQSASGKYVKSATHRILRNRGWLIISPLQPGVASVVVINEAAGTWEFEGGKLILTEIDADQEIEKGSNKPSIALLDRREIRFPLLLRKWKAGDYFYPLGMTKKKKLSRFFIDGKLSLNEKENIWVIEMDKKIIWVVNHRIDDRFKMSKNTRSVLQLALIPAGDSPLEIER